MHSERRAGRSGRGARQAACGEEHSQCIAGRSERGARRSERTAPRCKRQKRRAASRLSNVVPGEAAGFAGTGFIEQFYSASHHIVRRNKNGLYQYGGADICKRPLQMRVEISKDDLTHVVQIAMPVDVNFPADTPQKGSLVDLETFVASDSWRILVDQVDRLHECSKKLFFSALIDRGCDKASGTGVLK
ncbi:MAG: hypothetical protein LBI68_02950 [Azoarcus sp.]|jgi:hypothetical protein|nr:hypothetical protein [Azoarcus sp.]